MLHQHQPKVELSHIRLYYRNPDPLGRQFRDLFGGYFKKYKKKPVLLWHRLAPLFLRVYMWHSHVSGKTVGWTESGVSLKLTRSYGRKTGALWRRCQPQRPCFRENSTRAQRFAPQLLNYFTLESNQSLCHLLTSEVLCILINVLMYSCILIS